MKTTADEFRKKPHDVYYVAAQGETVVINHDRYRDKVFEITARKRGAAQECNNDPKKNSVSTLDALFEITRL